LLYDRDIGMAGNDILDDVHAPILGAIVDQNDFIAVFI
jgi:hypothetical protein